MTQIQPITISVDENQNKPAFKNQKGAVSSYLNATEIPNTQNLVKPLPGKGHLVHDKFSGGVKYFFKDVAYDIKSVKDCFNGVPNDHEAGRLNDVGLRLGAVAIATFLAINTKSPRKKIMEFVGLASFLGSMSLFPKLFINLPARMVHGFDIDKQYIDDQGRKKSVFQDSNYIPFDLYRGERKDEDLDIIGDRLGIPRDIHNRHDVIKEQMRKIATQNNTLWMLTAGFATPLMSALICCGLEKPIENLIEKKKNAATDKEIIEAYSNVKSLADISVDGIKENELSTKMSEILAKYKDKKLTEENIEEIKKVFMANTESTISESIGQDIEKILTPTTAYKVNINNVIGKKFNGNFILTELEIKEILSKLNIENDIVDKENFNKIKKAIKDYLCKGKKLNDSQEKLMKSIAEKISNALLEETKTTVLSAEKSEQILNFTKIIGEFQKYELQLDKLMSYKLGFKENTVIANAYNNCIDEIAKCLNLSLKDLECASESEKYASELLTKKLNEICADEAKYSKVIEKIAKTINEMDSKLHGNNENSALQELINAYNQLFHNTAKKLNELGVDVASNTVSSIIGNSNPEKITAKDKLVKILDGMRKKSDVARTSVKDAKIANIINRYQENFNSFFRLLHTFDFFKQTAKSGLDANESIATELREKGRSVLLNASTPEFIDKFGIENGVDFYKQFIKALTSFEDNQEMDIFKRKGTLADETSAVLEKYNLAERLGYYKARIYDIVANTLNSLKKDYNVGNGSELYNQTERNYKSVSNIVAASPSSMLKKAAEQRRGNKKWLKIIGISTAAVCSTTVLAQFLLGKMDNVHNLKKQVQNDKN